MKTVMLACSVGISTNVLVRKLQKEIIAQDIEWEVFAVPISEVKEELKQRPVDVLLIGPQSQHYKEELNNLYGEELVISTISAKDYGQMNAENILKQLLNLL